MLLAGLQPRQRLGKDLVAIAAQPFDVDPRTNRADGPVAAVAGRVLHGEAVRANGRDHPEHARHDLAGER